MTRRAFLPAAATGAALGANAANPQSPAIIDLRYSYLRNNAENQRQRLTDFLQKSVMPAMKRAGAGPFGVFSSNIAPDSPFILTVTSYPSLAAMEEISNKLYADEEFNKGMQAMDALPGL